MTQTRRSHVRSGLCLTALSRMLVSCLCPSLQSRSADLDCYQGPSWLRIDRATVCANLGCEACDLPHLVSCVQGLVLPGEKVDVTITAHVDDTLASQLNVGQVHLEDTLVLHTAFGRDHFVAVSVDYGP